jgi:hypothetical protein
MFPVIGLAQNPPSRCVKEIDLAQSVKNVSFIEYPSETKVGMSFYNQNQVKNTTPEELMASILCANTQEWVNFNDLEPTVLSKEKELAINKAKRSENYFHLLSKLEFEANGLKYALIKFRLTIENNSKPLYMTETMVKIDNRWKRITESPLTNLIFMLGMTRQEYLMAFFKNTLTENKSFDDLKKQSLIDNQPNINKFIKITQEYAIKSGLDKMQFMLEPSNVDYSKTSPVLNKFTEYPSNDIESTFSYPLRKTEYCTYFDDETNKQIDTTFFGKHIMTSEKIETIRPDSVLKYIHSFSFFWEENEIMFVKAILNTRIQLFIFENQKLILDIPERFQPIRNIFQTLKPDSFWAFYSTEPSGIKEIDKIKARFKDSEGILDIDKLGTYLATKPKDLEKYCDY